MRKITIIATIACVGLLAGTASAAVIPWTTPSGSTTNLDYSGGGSDNGLFGDPTIVGDSFYFFPSNFIASATDGGSQITNDRLQITLTAHPGFTPTGVLIQELGDYQMTGSGTVSVSGSLVLTNNLIPFPPQVRTDPLSANPGSPIAGTDTSGQWDADAGVDLSGESIDWSSFTLVLSNSLSATADPGSTASIEKLFAGGAVVVTVVPEPASCALVMLGAAGILARRRRPA